MSYDATLRLKRFLSGAPRFVDTFGDQPDRLAAVAGQGVGDVADGLAVEQLSLIHI